MFLAAAALIPGNSLDVRAAQRVGPRPRGSPRSPPAVSARSSTSAWLVRAGTQLHADDAGGIFHETRRSSGAAPGSASATRGGDRVGITPRLQRGRKYRAPASFDGVNSARSSLLTGRCSRPPPPQFPRMPRPLPMTMTLISLLLDGKAAASVYVYHTWERGRAVGVRTVVCAVKTTAVSSSTATLADAVAGVRRDDAPPRTDAAGGSPVFLANTRMASSRRARWALSAQDRAPPTTRNQALAVRDYRLSKGLQKGPSPRRMQRSSWPDSASASIYLPHFHVTSLIAAVDGEDAVR